ncbi:MAG: hypothetical protein ACOC2H_10060 [Spirochaetota bacterium]
MTNEKFIGKAPQDIIEKERSKKEQLESMREKIQTAMNNLTNI